MTEHAAIRDNCKSSLASKAPDESNSPPAPGVDRNLLTFLHECKRLFAEAEARVEIGDLMPALSSLAALPPLHSNLCERLSQLVQGDPQAPDETTSCGMYL